MLSLSVFTISLDECHPSIQPMNASVTCHQLQKSMNVLDFTCMCQRMTWTQQSIACWCLALPVPHAFKTAPFKKYAGKKNVRIKFINFCCFQILQKKIFSWNGVHFDIIKNAANNSFLTLINFVPGNYWQILHWSVLIHSKQFFKTSQNIHKEEKEMLVNKYTILWIINYLPY